MVNPKHILMIRPSALGDVCRSVPVLVSLRRAFPDARIDWIVQEEFVPAVACHPDLTGVIGFPRSRLAGWWRGPRQFIDMVGWFGGLRTGRYDLVIDCQGLSRSALMALASGAKIRVGLRRSREFAWLLYNTRIAGPARGEPPLHTVDQMLSLVEGIGVPAQRDMRLYAAAPDKAWWRAACESLGLAAGSYAVIAPTARWISKRWPIERFSQMIEPLHARGFSRAVVIGSPSEVDQVQEIFRRFPPARLGMDRAQADKSFVLDLVGATSIGQTMAVIAEAGLVLANDSAPLHMAAGFGRPLVSLFGPTDPAVVGPYGMNESVVRGYQPRPGEAINYKDPRLGDRLMRFISTTAVVQKVDRVLASPFQHSATQPRERSRIGMIRPEVVIPEDLGQGAIEGAAS